MQMDMAQAEEEAAADAAAAAAAAVEEYVPTPEEIAAARQVEYTLTHPHTPAPIHTPLPPPTLCTYHM